MKYLFITVILLSSLFLAGCSADKWQANYEKSGDSRLYHSQEFATGQECANWMEQAKEQDRIVNTGRFGYECGSNCKLSDSGIIFVCDETFDN